VAADARARVVGQEAVGLGRGGTDDLDRVDAVEAGGGRHLVGEGEVDGAEGVLLQLGELGGLGRGDDVQLRRGRREHLGRGDRARLADAAEHARHGRLLPQRVTGVDALRREGDVDVLADGEAALLERIDEQVARRADVGRRREDDRLPGAGVLDGGGAGRTDGGEVRVEVLVDRGRDGDDDRVGHPQARGVGGERELARVDRGGQPRPVAIEQIDLSRENRLEATLGDVDAQDREAGVPQREARRQADVAKAEDGDDEDIRRRRLDERKRIGLVEDNRHEVTGGDQRGQLAAST
jgi:hypothetical protein